MEVCFVVKVEEVLLLKRRGALLKWRRCFVKVEAVLC